MSKGSDSSSGGITAGGAINAMMMGYNLLSMFQKPKKQKLYLSANQNVANNIRKRKNLLDQQLAARRAQLGAMGITNSESSIAVEERMAREAFEDISVQEENLYDYTVDEGVDTNNDQRNKALMSAIQSFANKVIK